MNTRQPYTLDRYAAEVMQPALQAEVQRFLEEERHRTFELVVRKYPGGWRRWHVVRPWFGCVDRSGSVRRFWTKRGAVTWLMEQWLRVGAAGHVV